MYPQERFAKCCILCSLLTCFTLSVFSQETSADQPAPWSDYTFSRLGADSRLYNGLEYVRNGINAKGMAFFEVDSLRPGNIFYDGLLYHNIPMEYDMVQDKLVIPYFTGSVLMSLISEKLRYFSTGRHRFCYIDTGGTAPQSGFYEELYHNGAVTLLARRTKELIFPGSKDDIPRYVQHNSYFLRLEDRYFPIGGEHDLLGALRDKRDAVKKYIRKNKLGFKKTLEPSLIQTIDYYLQISH